MRGGIIDAAWMRRASCTVWPELPWTTDAGRVSPWDAARMRAVCDGCPVRAACLATVHALPVTGGWWAGADRDPDTAPVAAPCWARGGDECAQGVLPLEFGLDLGVDGAA